MKQNNANGHAMPLPSGHKHTKTTSFPALARPESVLNAYKKSTRSEGSWSIVQVYNEYSLSIARSYFEYRKSIETVYDKYSLSIARSYFKPLTKLSKPFLRGSSTIVSSQKQARLRLENQACGTAATAENRTQSVLLMRLECTVSVLLVY